MSTIANYLEMNGRRLVYFLLLSVVLNTLFPYKTHLPQMCVNLAAQDLNFFGELGQRRSITLRKLFDTSRQRLGDAVQFGLYVRRKCSQPFVFHYERLHFVLA